MRTYPRWAAPGPTGRLIGGPVKRRNITHASCVRLVRRGNIPTHPASDWSVVRIYPCVLRLIGGWSGGERTAGLAVQLARGGGERGGTTH
eukprot:1181820-Prorocentrum_minimum.AAC.1